MPKTKPGLKKFRVIYEYRGTVTAEVDAENETDADIKGRADADSMIAGNLYIYYTDVEEIS